MLSGVPERLFRVLSAMIAGGVVTLGILYTLAMLTGGDWVIIPENQPGPSQQQSIEEDADSWTVSLDSSMNCDEKVDTITTLIADSRACITDSDCELPSFGCTIGCLVSVNAQLLARLEHEHQPIESCRSCVYSCRAPIFEWRAVCVEDQCAFKDGSIIELERRTLEEFRQ